MERLKDPLKRSLLILQLGSVRECLRLHFAFNGCSEGKSNLQQCFKETQAHKHSIKSHY
jgi:hypothetical protein